MITLIVSDLVASLSLPLLSNTCKYFPCRMLNYWIHIHALFKLHSVISHRLWSMCDHNSLFFFYSKAHHFSIQLVFCKCFIVAVWEGIFSSCSKWFCQRSLVHQMNVSFFHFLFLLVNGPCNFFHVSFIY